VCVLSGRQEAGELCTRPVAHKKLPGWRRELLTAWPRSDTFLLTAALASLMLFLMLSMLTGKVGGVGFEGVL